MSDNPANLFDVPDGWYVAAEIKEGSAFRALAIRNKHCEVWARDSINLPNAATVRGDSGTKIHVHYSRGRSETVVGWMPVSFSYLGELTWICNFDGTKNEWLEKYEVE